MWQDFFKWEEDSSQPPTPTKTQKILKHKPHKRYAKLHTTFPQVLFQMYNYTTKKFLFRLLFLTEEPKKKKRNNLLKIIEFEGEPMIK